MFKSNDRLDLRREQVNENLLTFFYRLLPERPELVSLRQIELLVNRNRFEWGKESGRGKIC